MRICIFYTAFNLKNGTFYAQQIKWAVFRTACHTCRPDSSHTQTHNNNLKQAKSNKSCGVIANNPLCETETLLLLSRICFLLCFGTTLMLELGNFFEKRSHRGNPQYRLKESHLKWGWVTQDGSTQPGSNERNEKKEKSLLDVLNHFTLQPAKGLNGKRDQIQCQVEARCQKHTWPQTS